MPPIIVSIINLTKTFGDFPAVHDLTLTMEQGQFMSLLGPSGCGKTTTLRLLAGFEEPDRGSIKIGDQMVTGPDVFVPPEKRRVGMVFQSYALFPHLTVEKNITYGLSKQEAKSGRVQDVLDMIRLAHLTDRMPHELSGGQQQRVALARALAPKPDLILLDEPFSNLDASLRVAVRNEVRDILRQANATTLFVTHDQEEALSLSDRVAVMIDGEVVQVAQPQDLYQRPATRGVASFLGDANFVSGTASNGTVTCELGQMAIRGDMSGAVEIMLRPEEIQLSADENGSARIVEHQYYGHDQIVVCQLASGIAFRARQIGMADGLVPGASVRYSLPERVTVFPA